MNILHIIPSLKKGGAERLVTDIIRELNAKETIEVRLVLFRDEIEYDIDDIKGLIKIIPSSVQLSFGRENTIQVDELQACIDDYLPDIIHSHLFEAEIISRSCYYPNAKWFSHVHDNMIQFKNFTVHTLTNKSLFTNYFENIFEFSYLVLLLGRFQTYLVLNKVQ
jgi:hypothetical protein